MASRPGRQGYEFTLPDVRFLTSASGRELLAQFADLPLTDSSLLTDLTRIRRATETFATALAETIRLRRRAREKFGSAARDWLLTEIALQQGSPAPVAAHRAARLAGIGVHDLTCSIGADLHALALTSTVSAPVVGSDLDPVRAAMAAWNLRTATGSPRAPVFVADALTVTTRSLLGYADPGRRDAGGRRISSADTMPPVADLDRVHARRPPLLRLPPGIDYERLGRPGEVEIVSLDGSAREALLWPAEVAAVGRRATVLRTTDIGSGAGSLAYQVLSTDPEDIPIIAASEWIIDPDPAVVRAGLVRHFGARHGLAQLDPHLAYLTGPRAPAGHRAFRVLDSAELREKTIREWLRRDGIGTLEIKQRGTGVVPEELRHRLRPAMSQDTTAAATLIAARVGRRQMAYWCRAAVG